MLNRQVDISQLKDGQRWRSSSPGHGSQTPEIRAFGTLVGIRTVVVRARSTFQAVKCSRPHEVAREDIVLRRKAGLTIPERLPTSSHLTSTGRIKLQLLPLYA